MILTPVIGWISAAPLAAEPTQQLPQISGSIHSSFQENAGIL